MRINAMSFSPGIFISQCNILQKIEEESGFESRAGQLKLLTVVGMRR